MRENAIYIRGSDFCCILPRGRYPGFMRNLAAALLALLMTLMAPIAVAFAAPIEPTAVYAGMAAQELPESEIVVTSVEQCSDAVKVTFTELDSEGRPAQQWRVDYHADGSSELWESLGKVGARVVRSESGAFFTVGGSTVWSLVASEGPK